MPQQEVYSPEAHLDELFLLNFGEQHCEPGHFNGPKLRDSYIFHFVFSGKGIFKCLGKTYHLAPNQGFFIEKSTPIYYQADEKDPWHYGWIGISGKQANILFNKLSLSPQTPIYKAKKDADLYPAFKNLIHHASDSVYDLFASLFAFLAALETNSAMQPSKTVDYKNTYAQRAEKYILSNYHSPNLRIEQIAKEIGIDRSYLSRLFVEKFHCSPQSYLLRLRMEKAKTFLLSTDQTVQLIATSVGYPSLDAFSKIYKKTFGISPSQTRKNTTPPPISKRKT